MDELLQRARAFDMQALTEIYDTYSPGLYAYAYRLLGDQTLAEDCVAETFSRFLRSLKNGRGPEDYLQAYLYRIAHNWVSDQYRRQPPPPLELPDQLPGAQENHPEQLVSQKLMQSEVRAALHRLTPEQRQVIVLRFFEGWENDQVSAALKKPVGAVKALQHRAVLALRHMLLGDEEVVYETLK